MHLIHKLRRSISHRPRHLFDLPDEILCLILEYCCQDLDFLLWSCPLVTLDSQFCHDCFHCTLCHGPVPHSSSHRQRRQSRAATFAEKHSNTRSQGAESSSSGKRFRREEDSFSQGGNPSTTSDQAHHQHGKRRKRNIDPLVLSSNSRRLSNAESNAESFQSSQQGAQPCPWNGDRPWCLHLQRRQSDRIPLLWRLVPPPLRPASYGSRPLFPVRFSSIDPYSHLTTLSTSFASMQPSAKVAFNTLLQKIEAFFFMDRPRENVPRHIQPDGSMPIPPRGHTTSTLISAFTSPSAPRHAVAPMACTTGFSLDQDESLHRRRTMSMGIGPAQPTLLNITTNRSLNTTGTTHLSTIWKSSDWRSVEEEEEEEESETSENGQHKDNFDSSINLAPPFQLLLVSRRFADAAVHSLHRNLVFHGHDPYQMESILCTLYRDDGFSNQDQNRSVGLGDIKEEQLMEEGDGEQDDKFKDEMMGAQGTSRSHAGVVNGERSGSVSYLKDGSSTGTSLLQIGIGQGASLSWVEALNQSLRRFSLFQGGALGADTSNTGIETTKTFNLGGNARYTGETGGGGSGRWHSNDEVSMAGENQGGDPNEPRWPYRRYARRVVLNFAHPQASPHMLVRALECIASRCSDQIQALDLHANEKMQDAGLETPEELTRLFGSGFSKLRYLRLQGGFVDNQLLYALLKNFSLSLPNLSSESSHGRLGDEWRSFSEPTCRSSLPAPNFETCCLSQVFLGPGSVTDNAVEKLIDVAGKTLEVLTVTSCVDVSGGALASLLTKCPRLRVLGVHRSLARDRELLEGLGIPLESTITGPQQHHQLQQQQQSVTSNDSQDTPPAIVRKPVIAPLERLELGTVKLTNVGVAEILKATCKTLRFLVLETQHFSEGVLRNVIAPLCTRLEGLHFDDPEQVQRLQQQMQGLGFSAGRRGPYLPRHQIVFGRSGRSFYSDPGDYYRSHMSHSPLFQPQHLNRQGGVSRSTSADRKGVDQSARSSKVSAWLGEITTDEWVDYGDCALWGSAASPAVSYDNGGAGGPLEGRFLHQSRQYRQPFHQIYHKPALALGNIFVHGFGHHLRHQSVTNWLLGDTDELLHRHQVSRELVDEVQEALPKLETFTVRDLDFILERKGINESRLLMRQDDAWVQSAGFRALQMFYLCLFLSTIYFSIFR